LDNKIILSKVEIKFKKEKSVRISVVWSMLRYIASSKINNKPLTDTKYNFSIIVEKNGKLDWPNRARNEVYTI